MENNNPETVKKFCTNCEESVDKTEKTPASFTNVAKNMANAGNNTVATTPANTDGNPTRMRVIHWIFHRSDANPRPISDDVFSASLYFCDNRSAARWENAAATWSNMDGDGVT